LPQTSDRTRLFTESVIRQMTRVALEHDAINLSQGFPDFDPPTEVVEAAKRALDGPHHQYAITWGAPRFRQALAAKLTRSVGIEVAPDRNLVVTCGSTEAMMAAMMSVCNPGDKVIVFSPFYENYGADSILSGAQPVYVSLRPPNYEFDPAELRTAFAQGVKALVLCNPSNPSGKVFTRQELELVLALAQEHDAFVITDEVYEHIVYEPYRHTYLSALPGALDRVIMCGSLSKTYSITGWRLGYVMAHERIIDSVRKVHDFLTVGAAAPLQEAAVTALELPPSYYDELQRSYTRKRDVLLGYLERAGLTFTRPQGAYYVMVDISRFGHPSDTDFCRWLAREIGVAAVPGSSFFREPDHRYMRLHFAKREDTLHAAGERLLRLSSR
jgi:aspartate/methionine/tyrosine aminotransferase